LPLLSALDVMLRLYLWWFVCIAQIRPEQALAAAEAKMELHELNVWKDNLLTIIEQPREEFKWVILTAASNSSRTLMWSL